MKLAANLSLLFNELPLLERVPAGDVSRTVQWLVLGALDAAAQNAPAPQAGPAQMAAPAPLTEAERARLDDLL